MFLLDTNTVSKLMRAPTPTLLRHFNKVARVDLRVPSIVEGELRYGLIKKGIEKTKLGILVDTFLKSVTILPWTSATAECFAKLRTDSEARGVTVDTVDLMIATHAKEDKLTLVTNDAALHLLKPWIKVVDWTQE
jgi:tRNA(fMet)-specific endonuclease VapC